MPRVVHFEIPAKNREKVAAFYRDVFDWEIAKWDGPMEYWMVITGEKETPGINGALYKPETGVSGTINTLDVDDLDAYLKKVTSNGGEIVVDKMTIPSVGYLAYCKDVEGTVFGMMQSDPNAEA